MRLDPLKDCPHRISGYEAGQIEINGQTYRHSVWLSLSSVQAWRPRNLMEVNNSDFAAILADQPDIILLGTGSCYRSPHPSLLTPIWEQHIGIEAMDTAAAIRSFALIAADSRPVIAALLIE